MIKDFSQTVYTELLIKTTLTISLVSFFLIGPFSLYNFYIQNYLLAFSALFITFLCMLNAYFSSIGRYSQILNLWVLVPLISAADAYAIITYGSAGSYWAFPGILYFYFVLPEKLSGLSNLLFLVVIIPIAWIELEPAIAIRFIVAIIGISLYAFFTLRAISKLLIKFKTQASTDFLTKLNNRQLLQESLEHSIAQFQRSKVPVTLMMIDLDHFKSINDRFGHDKGDEVIKSVSNLIKHRFRDSDSAFRVGGEEFLVLLYNSNLEESLTVADELLNDIRELNHSFNEIVSASIGLASLEDQLDWQEWMKICDHNMYQAKQNGRNQVVS